MSMLVNITQAEIRGAAKELDGKVLTRPLRSLTDGISLIYVVDVEIGEGKILRNVPIARANRELIYAETGAAVRLRRTESGGYEVVGFSKKAPGKYMAIPVSISPIQFGHAGSLPGSLPAIPVIEVSVGEPIDRTVTGRVLTYSELSALGTYGVTPYGAIGIYQGSELQEIKA